MKKTIIPYLFLVTFLSFESCSSTQKTILTIQPKVIAISDTIKTKFVIDNEKRLEGTSFEKKVFGRTVKSNNNYAEVISIGDIKNDKANLKSAAVFNSLQGTKYDVLVSPRYTVVVKKSLFSQTTTVKVTGFGAYEVIGN